jgi:hypothetical protein
VLRASGPGIAAAPGEVRPIHPVAVAKLSPCGTEPPGLNKRIGGQNPNNNEDKCENEGTDKIVVKIPVQNRMWNVQITLVKTPTAEISALTLSVGATPPAAKTSRMHG